MTTTLTAVRAITLLTDVDGDGQYDSGDTVKTTLTVTNTGAQDATNVTISDPALLQTVTNVSPIAVNDFFTAVGNTVLRVGGASNIGSGPSSVVAGNVLSNDADTGPGSNSFTLTAVSGGATTQGGTFNLNADGSFNYVGAAGFEGNDTFTYTIRDAGADGIAGNADDLTGTGLVTIAVGGAAGQVWYVDSSAGTGGTGTSANPFNSITTANLNGASDLDGAGDYIYVKGTPGAVNLALEANEHLIGTGGALTVGGFTLANAGANSAITSASGTTLTLSTGNELSGIDINGTGSAGGIAGTNFGTVTVSGVGISTAGPALSLNTGTVAGIGFNSTTSTGGTNNVALTSVAGTVNLGSGALSGATGNGVNINGGAGSVDYNGTVTHNANAQAIVVTGKTGGTVQFDGAVTSNGASNGVNLTSNTGATINFNGGLAVNLTAVATGFNATGGGTVNVTGASNSIKSASGTAVNINGTAIGASGVTLHDVSSGNNTAAADPTVGISLVNTGSTGFFRVTGGSTTAQGGDASGGTIQHITGADGATQDDGTSNGQGIGIYLNNASNVTLDRMQINDTSNFAVEAENSTNVVLSYSRINGQNGDSAAQDEGAVRILDLHGTNRIYDNDISGGFEDNVRVDNSTGNLTALIIDSNNIHDNNTANGNQGILIDVENGISAAYFIQNNTFSHNRADSVFIGASGGAASASALIGATITGNTFQGNRASDLGGGLAIHTANFDGHLQYDVSNNLLQPTAGNLGVNQGGAIDIDAGAASSAAVHSTLVEGRVSNNIIGVTGVANSGTQQGSGILLGLHGGGTHTVAVTGNTIRQYGNSGIQITAGDSGVTGGNFNLSVTGNTITEKANAAGGAPNGLLATFGTSSTGPNSFHVNLDISGNSLAGSGNNVNIGEEDFRIRQRFSTDIFLKGYTGALDDTAAVVAYVQSQNIGTETGTATTQSAADAVGFHNLASVPQPNLPPASPPPPAPGTAPEGAVSGAPVLDPGLAASLATRADMTMRDVAMIGMESGAFERQAAFLRHAPVAFMSNDFGSLAGVAGVAAAPSTDAPPAFGQPVVVDDGVLSQAELNLVVAAAIDRWAAAGATAEQVAVMRAVNVSVASLAGLELGQSGAGNITLDSNAAGYGWFIDATPGEDSEFANGLGLQGTPAATRVDLLTVIEHELGHQVGLSDRFDGAGVNGLMFGALAAGERRTPSLADVAAAGTVPVTETAFVLSPVNIGTLSPGQSSTLSFTSTINSFSNQLIPTGAAATSASTVTAGNVTGAVTSNSNTLVIDSLALGDLIFLDADASGTFNAGDSGISGVALSLFADSDGNGVLNGAEATTVIATTTSIAGGAYSFTGLAPGDYVVRVDASNFTGGGALVGKLATAPGAPDPDNNINNDNNGTVSGGAVFTAPIRLDYNSETTAGVGNDTNNTLDIGVLAPNVAPTLTATGGNPVYTEDAAAVDLYSAVTASIGTGDAGQTFTSLSLNITNVTDGASEILRIDGTDVALVGGNTTTATNGLTVSVATIGTQAFVSFSGASLTVAQLQTLVDGLSYRDISQNPTDANRVVTITQLVDSGSNVSPNSNTATLNLASTVNVNPVDDLPVAGNDSNAVLENATITGASVLGNDSDVDGPALSVATVNGSAANVGTQITLASGALLTLNANGTYDYNPNGKFNYLTDNTSGAVDTSATDSFIYTLTGPSNTATVTITVNGVAGAGDILAGDGGNNTINGTPGNDYFDLSQGGNDTVNGGSGDDAFFFGAAFTPADTVNGGPGGNDQVGLQGDYSAGLTLGATTLVNVEVLAVLPGFSYNITTNDANVAAGGLLNIFGGNLAAGQNLTFDGSAETNGAFRVYGGLGTDTLSGGAGDDGFYFGPGKYGATDVVHGNGGTNDQLALDGNYTVTIDSRADVEVVVLLGGPGGSPNSFNVTLADNWAAAGETKTVFGTSVTTALTVNGAAESNANLIIYGGSAGDTLTGGAGADMIFGNGGGDTLKGNAGNDIFLYDAASQSTSTGYDTLADFTYGSDTIKISGQTHDTYASVTGGQLNTATFDSDLATALNAQLTGGAAVFYAPDAGTLAGQVFLVVDANGIDGYQAGGDYVFHLPSVEPTPGTPDFIV